MEPASDHSAGSKEDGWFEVSYTILPGFETLWLLTVVEELLVSTEEVEEDELVCVVVLEELTCVDVMGRLVVEVVDLWEVTATYPPTPAMIIMTTTITTSAILETALTVILFPFGDIDTDECIFFKKIFKIFKPLDTKIKKIGNDCLSGTCSVRN